MTIYFCAEIIQVAITIFEYKLTLRVPYRTLLLYEQKNVYIMAVKMSFVAY